MDFIWILAGEDYCFTPEKNGEKLMDKLHRQIHLYLLLTHDGNEGFHGRREIFRKRLASNVRMIQRDIRDLTDAGLLRVKYNSKRDTYFLTEYGFDPEFQIDKSISESHRKHLNKIRRLCILWEKLDAAEPFEISRYEEGGLDLPPSGFLDARTSYHKLFPEISEGTMRRDFKILEDIGFSLIYNRKYKIFLIESECRENYYE